MSGSAFGALREQLDIVCSERSKLRLEIDEVKARNTMLGDEYRKLSRDVHAGRVVTDNLRQQLTEQYAQGDRQLEAAKVAIAVVQKEHDFTKDCLQKCSAENERLGQAAQDDTVIINDLRNQLAQKTKERDQALAGLEQMTTLRKLAIKRYETEIELSNTLDKRLEEAMQSNERLNKLALDRHAEMQRLKKLLAPLLGITEERIEAHQAEMTAKTVKLWNGTKGTVYEPTPGEKANAEAQAFADTTLKSKVMAKQEYDKICSYFEKSAKLPLGFIGGEPAKGMPDVPLPELTEPIAFVQGISDEAIDESEAEALLDAFYEQQGELNAQARFIQQLLGIIAKR